MPELPDLEYVRDRLRDELLSSGPRDLMEFRVRQPVVIRNLSGRPLEDLMAGCQLAGIQRVGPFLQFEFGQARLAVHPMLAGAFRLAERPQMRALCVAFRFGEQSWLHVRGSNTEPVVRIIAQGDSAAQLKEVLARARDALKQV